MYATAIYYEFEYKVRNGKRGIYDGLILEKGEINCCLEDNQDELISLIEEHSGHKVVDLREFQSISKKI